MAQAKKAPAKKAPAKKETPVQVEAPKVTFTNETPPMPAKPAKPKWEFKDRLYQLSGNKTPLVHVIQSRHSQNSPLLYFDKEKGYNRELRYATNQQSCFVDEQEGAVTLGRIYFENGNLFVEKENPVLQKFLSLYHPMTLDGRIVESKPEEDAIEEVDMIEAELLAMNTAQALDIDIAEAIMRAEIGSKVTQMSSKELKRDLLVFARRNPYLFLELANDDNVHLRNIGIRATEAGIINLSGDNRTFSYGNTGRKLMTVPFDEHPYSALAAYFKTDEGMEVLNAIEKRL